MSDWNKAIYAVVNKEQLDEAIAQGRVNPAALRERLKGYPQEGSRVSLDGKWCVFEAEKVGDIAYLRQRAAHEGIGYTEYTADSIGEVMDGPNWRREEQI